MPVSPYTRERLAAAAESSRTLSEALRKLGVDPKSSTRRYILERMKRMGIATSHFEREGARWTKEVLEPVVAASASVCEVLRRLGLDVVGGHHTNISRRIKTYGIDTSHFRAPSRRGETRSRRTPRALLVEQTSQEARRIPSERLKRAMTALGVSECCDLCGTEPVWRGNPLPLEVDHIDGNWRNNRIENLRLLCPNCHSTTDTYRGRGKGRIDVAAS
ncbi:HNH endonuclease signature motif containing protein [Streptomyces sp. NBC_01481]|uniref:HNH endonuclease signature motif containing protein n=1 Tax=Streptomyces sp. NBC_01481 TaxID=2975869 RepID=UPI00225895FD|nr:HNH endonuclease signature motif containing protein [Streptomyces sp. NBC_01481]MCX4581869.1 HNH endonuclease [Streptomyces sp. NBC_01481]